MPASCITFSDMTAGCDVPCHLMASSGSSRQQGHQGSTPPWAVHLHDCAHRLRLPDRLPLTGCTPGHTNQAAVGNGWQHGKCNAVLCAACYATTLIALTRKPACGEPRALLGGLYSFWKGTARAAPSVGDTTAAGPVVQARAAGAATFGMPACALTGPSSAIALAAGVACTAATTAIAAAGAVAGACTDGNTCAGI